VSRDNERMEIYRHIKCDACAFSLIADRKAYMPSEKTAKAAFRQL
jgi:hypothetical protein